MASELSRLIDDELEKFERRPSGATETRQKTSFSIKADAQRDALGKQYSWRQKEWWTWRRIVYVTLILVSLFGILVLLPRGSAAAKTALAGTNNAAVSQSGEAVGGSFFNAKGTEASPIESPTAKHTRNSIPEYEEATSPTLSEQATSNQTAPAQVIGSVAAMTPNLAVAESPVILESATSPSVFSRAEVISGASSQAYSPRSIGLDSAAVPAPSQAKEMEANSPNSLLKISLGRRLLGGQ